MENFSWTINRMTEMNFLDFTFSNKSAKKDGNVLAFSQQIRFHFVFMKLIPFRGEIFFCLLFHATDI